MPLSGLLSSSEAGWPSIFYVFGVIGAIWSVFFLIFVFEDPESHPRIGDGERKYIISNLWGAAGSSVRYHISDKFYIFELIKLNYN